MSFDLDKVLRRLKPLIRSTASLARRPPTDLPFIDDHLRPGPELLLDTTVYIDGLQDRSPREVDHLMAMRICNHSAVCLAELTHAFGRLDPDHPETDNALDTCRRTVNGIRPHRLREPSQSVWGTAGVLAGLAFRLGGYIKGQERKLLNDALVFLQALEHGQTVLTRNMSDFDVLNQMIPDGRILLYKTLQESAA